MRTTTKGERASWRWSRWRHRSPPGRWSKPPTAPRHVTRPPRPAATITWRQQPPQPDQHRR